MNINKATGRRDSGRRFLSSQARLELRARRRKLSDKFVSLCCLSAEFFCCLYTSVLVVGHHLWLCNFWWQFRRVKGACELGSAVSIAFVQLFSFLKPLGGQEQVFHHFVARGIPKGGGLLKGRIFIIFQRERERRNTIELFCRNLLPSERS